MLIRKTVNTALIIAKDPTDSLLFSEIMKMKGYSSDRLISCPEVCEALKENKRKIKVVVVDLDLPCVKNGTFLKDLKSIKKQVKIIAYTCGSQPETNMAVYKSLIDYIFVKPVRLYKFVEILDIICSTRITQNSPVIVS